jgi:alkanesulfonate monooxygenase SsuD/methylene tetrahydromethanopterin reductase-like flavin-dependent oxidoreductase (luciferase family)
MQYGINLPAFADFADPYALVELARDAEVAGWDGFFIWDHMVFDPSWHSMLDPWVGLAAVALATERVRIGTLLTPLPRRRPWKLARETVTLDYLSRGRVTLGVGIGDPVKWEFGFFGEETDAKTRAAMLDEGLTVLTGLWRAEPFSFAGEHYRLDEMIFKPGPIQQPRIPIWVGGYWPRKPPFRRAARWDGVCPGRADNQPLTPQDWRDILAFIKEHRESDAPFDAVGGGQTSGTERAQDAELVATYAVAGVTWWIEDISPWRFGLDWEDQWTPDYSEQMRERVRRGPPRGD